MNTPSFSFEFFPPKSDKSEADLMTVVDDLNALDPKYMTVTYGAGGSTKDKTLEIASALARKYAVPIASHLTFLSTTKDDLDTYIEALWDNNVRHIVALRGDLPKGTTYQDFTGDQYYDYTSNFVIALKQKHDFEISVGAYPEKHPDAPSLIADIEALRLKCDAGATRAITQFFFDNEVYYRFLDKVAAAGIHTPICPGLLPVYDFKSMVRFAGKCDANVPHWMHEKFDGISDEDAIKIAEELLIKQSVDLAKNGVEHIHYYSMNKTPLTKAACESLKRG